MTEATALISLLLFGGVVCAQERPMTVCDVLGDLPAYRDKIIRVRGSVSTGAGSFLKDSAGECAATVRVGKMNFSTILSIEWPREPVRNEAGREAPFSFDKRSFDILQLALRRVNRRSHEVVITIDGLLLTRTPPAALSHPSNPDQPLGFGHLGAAPAAIVVKRVSDIETVPRDRTRDRK